MFTRAGAVVKKEVGKRPRGVGTLFEGHNILESKSNIKKSNVRPEHILPSFHWRSILEAPPLDLSGMELSKFLVEGRKC
jgi:hypothetical protein